MPASQARRATPGSPPKRSVIRRARSIGSAGSRPPGSAGRHGSGSGGGGISTGARRSSRAHRATGHGRHHGVPDGRVGGHVQRCDDCGATRITYNSCRNRHCPKCQGSARAKWLAVGAELLPVPYFHVVFTLPAPVGEIASRTKPPFTRSCPRGGRDACRHRGRSRHLGAQLGTTMVLHTWGQTLQHHPHVHGIVPGGGLSPDGTRWISCKPGFFLPVRVLSRLFRRLFLQKLKNAFGAGKLRFFTNLANLAEPQDVALRVIAELRPQPPPAPA